MNRHPDQTFREDVSHSEKEIPSSYLGRCDLLEKNREFVPVFEVLPPSAANVYPARPCDDSPLWRPSWAH